jgi:hypothetical protein
VLLTCASAYSQETQRGQTSGIREIVPGHYMFSSGDVNSGIIATSEGVVVFDALVVQRRIVGGFGSHPRSRRSVLNDAPPPHPDEIGAR